MVVFNATVNIYYRNAGVFILCMCAMHSGSHSPGGFGLQLLEQINELMKDYSQRNKCGMGLSHPNALGAHWEGERTPVPPNHQPHLCAGGFFTTAWERSTPEKSLTLFHRALISRLFFFSQKLMKLMRSDKRKGTQLTMWLGSGLRSEHSGLKHQHSNVGVSK